VEAIDALAGREFSRPIELDSYPGDRVFVAEQDGLVLLFNHDGSGEQVLLDIQGRVSRAGWEEGLLSVALDPGFAGNGHLWAYYSAANPQRSVIARFTVTGDVANPASELVVLAIEQPFANHNGGALRFGFDGMLYLGLGDGGSGNDPLGSGQDRSTLLGSIIRLDVRNASVATPYVVPADNPFVGEAGVRPEIWAYGMRNPWRMAFDPVTGALWVGDVGQGAMEEISVIRRGANYGWDIVEGTICHEPASGCDTEGLTFPVAVYDHSGGRCSITGGMVYRGSAVPEIAASYIYGDHCSGEVWALPVDGSSEPVLVASDLGDIIAFGVDGAGEVYVMRFGQSIVKLVSP
jgi:glucose/arabinose dehydrogenase